MSDAQISERLSDEAANHHSVGMTPVQVRVKPNETVFAAWRAGVWRFTKFTATQSKMVVTLNFADATTQPTSTTKPTSPAKAAVMR